MTLHKNNSYGVVLQGSTNTWALLGPYFTTDFLTFANDPTVTYIVIISMKFTASNINKT